MSLAITPPALQGIGGNEAPRRGSTKRALSLKADATRGLMQAAASKPVAAKAPEPMARKGSTGQADFISTWIHLIRAASEAPARAMGTASIEKPTAARGDAITRQAQDRGQSAPRAASGDALALAQAGLARANEALKAAPSNKEGPALNAGASGNTGKALAEESRIALEARAHERRGLAARGNESWNNGSSEAFAASADFALAGAKQNKALGASKVNIDDKGPEGASSRAKRLKVSVQDARTDAEKLAAVASQASKLDEAQASGKRDAGSADILSREMVVLLGERDGSGAPSDASSEKARAGSFQNLLSQALREDLGASIAREASIVLERSGEGRIKLNLRPESLGNVKIDLALKEGELSGKIVVRSEEARQAFEEGMAELLEAFEAEGFASPKLEVSVNSGRAWAENQGSGMGEDDPFFSRRLRAFEDEGIIASESAWAALDRAEALLDMYA